MISVLGCWVGEAAGALRWQLSRRAHAFSVQSTAAIQKLSSGVVANCTGGPSRHAMERAGIAVYCFPVTAVDDIYCEHADQDLMIWI